VKDFLIDSINEGKSKEAIAEELVQTAIDHGSADNVTVIVVNLAEMYQRWQRSTPFHCTSKMDYQLFTSD
jgi:serine/threonine protein phosphatase PrpC